MATAPSGGKGLSTLNLLLLPRFLRSVGKLFLDSEPFIRVEGGRCVFFGLERACPARQACQMRWRRNGMTISFVNPFFLWPSFGRLPALLGRYEPFHYVYLLMFVLFVAMRYILKILLAAVLAASFSEASTTPAELKSDRSGPLLPLSHLNTTLTCHAASLWGRPGGMDNVSLLSPWTSPLSPVQAKASSRLSGGFRANGRSTTTMMMKTMKMTTTDITALLAELYEQCEAAETTAAAPGGWRWLGPDPWLRLWQLWLVPSLLLWFCWVHQQASSKKKEESKGGNEVRFLASLPLLLAPALFLALSFQAPSSSSGCKSDFAGEYHNCALLTDKTLKCWGNNDVGQLGLGDTAYRGDGAGETGDYLPLVNLNGDVKSVALGQYHTCVAFTDNSAACWGDNDQGQLGQGNDITLGSDPNQMGSYLLPIDLGTNVYVDLIVAGADHTCIKSTLGQVKCWGDNSNGQLGYGDFDNRGGGPDQISDNLDFVDVGSGCVVVDLSLGEYHTCVLCSNGDVKCFGQNINGQLGQGDTNHRGDDSGEMGDYLPAIDFGSGLTVSEVFSGGNQNCVVFTDGSLKCFGRNAEGQLGYGDTNDRGDGPGEMGDYLPLVDVGSGRTVVDVCGGYYHTCAILDDYSVKCWGYNFQGQLGYGDQDQRGDGPNEMGDSLTTVDVGTGLNAESIHCGYLYTCAVLQDESMKCWGDNVDGQLGQGSGITLAAVPGEMGDYLPSIELGTGLTIQECFDLTPTMAPTITYDPTFNPTISFDPTFDPTTQIILFNDQTHALGVFYTQPYEPADLALNYSFSTSPVLFASSIAKPFNSSSDQLLFLAGGVESGSGEQGKLGVLESVYDFAGSFWEVDNFLVSGGLSERRLGESEAETGRSLLSAPSAGTATSLAYLDFLSHRFFFFALPSNQSLLGGEIWNQAVVNVTAVAGEGDTVSIVVADEAAGLVGLVAGSGSELVGVEVWLNGTEPSVVTSSSRESARLNLSTEAGCGGGRADVSAFSLMADVNADGRSNLVAGLPYCGQHGALLMVELGSGLSVTFEAWKVVEPFNESSVWRADVPSLSGVALPSFPDSVRQFGYRLTSAPDFNRDGVEDMWVVSFLNESWAGEEASPYPVSDGQRQVVVWLVSLVASPRVEEGVFVKDVMYSNLSYQPMPASHPRRTMGEAIVSTAGGLVLSAPDVGGSSEGWAYDVRIYLPEEFESFPEYGCRSCVNGSDLSVSLECENFYRSRMRTVCGVVEGYDSEKASQYLAGLDSGNSSSGLTVGETMWVAGEGWNASTIVLDDTSDRERRNLSVVCVGWVSGQPSPPVWRLEASRFDVELPRTLFEVRVSEPASAFLALASNVSTSHEGNVSCAAWCVGGCGSVLPYETRFYETTMSSEYSATFFGLAVGESYWVSCSGHDFASSWNDESGNDWTCNGTRFSNNEFTASTGFVNTSTTAMAPVRSATTSYPEGLNNLCSPLFPAACDLRGALGTCSLLLGDFWTASNSEQGCQIDLADGEYVLGSGSTDLRLTNSSYATTVWLTGSGSSVVSVRAGSEVWVEESVTLEVTDVSWEGKTEALSSALFSVQSGGALSMAASHFRHLRSSDSVVTLSSSSFSAEDMEVWNVTLSGSFVSGNSSSVSWTDCVAREVSGNGSLVEVSGFSSSTLTGVEVSSFSSETAPAIRVVDEAGLSMWQCELSSCSREQGEGCFLCSSNGWLYLEEVGMWEGRASDAFYVSSDGDLALVASEIHDSQTSGSEAFLRHSSGDLVVSATLFNSSSASFKSIVSTSTADVLIRNLEFVENENQISVAKQTACGVNQITWGDTVSSEHTSKTVKVCDNTANCEVSSSMGMICVCPSPLIGDPTTDRCVSPPGTITIVPEPVLVGSFLKPFSGNGSVYLINVGSSPVDYQLYGVESFCARANSSSNSSFLFSKPNNTNFDQLCSDLNETAGIEVSWEGINGTVVLCSFNTLNFTVRSGGLAKGDYESRWVVDSQSETGAEGLTISFSVSVTASQVHTDFDLYYFGSLNSTDVDESGKVNSSGNVSLKNDEAVFVLVEPRDLDGLAIFQSNDEVAVSVVNGSACSEQTSSVDLVVDDYHRLFECSFAYTDVGTRWVEVKVGGVAVGERRVEVVCKDGMESLGGTCTCGLGDELAGEACASCGGSSFKDWVGDGPCTACPSGSSANSDNTVCKCDNEGASYNLDRGECLCLPGYGFNGNDCAQCKLGEFKNNTANTVCDSCDDVISGSTTADVGSLNASYCLCGGGQYLNKRGTACQSCPDGVRCDQGTTVANMKIKSGYWRSDAGSDSILQCPVKVACAGGESESYGDNLCRSGHEGPYCDVCQKKHFKEYDGLCQSCSGSSLTESYTFIGLMSLLSILVIYGLIKYTCEVAQDESRTRGRSVFDFLEESVLERVLGAIGSVRRRLGFEDDVMERGAHSGRVSMFENPDDESNKEYRNQVILVKIKIIFVFFQVITLFQEVYQIKYADPFVGFLSVFSVLKLDLFSVAKMECAVSGSFLSKLLFATILPIGLALVLLAGWFVSRAKFGAGTKQHQIVENTVFNLFIIITYVLFPNLCTIIFSAFVCEDFDDGSSYMRADYSTSCDSSEYSSIVALATTMIFVYPLGIPTMYFVLMYREKDRLNPQQFFTDMSLGEAVLKREHEVNHLKFLYDAYLPKYWWTEVMECLRKLLLTGFVVFFYAGSALQIFASMVISMIFAVIYTRVYPYLMPSNNTFAIFVHFQVTFTLACTLLLRVSENYSSSEEDNMKVSEENLSWALLISNLSVLFLGAVFVIRACFNTSEGDFLDAGFGEGAQQNLPMRPERTGQTGGDREGMFELPNLPQEADRQEA